MFASNRITYITSGLGILRQINLHIRTHQYTHKSLHLYVFRARSPTVSLHLRLSRVKLSTILDTRNSLHMFNTLLIVKHYRDATRKPLFPKNTFFEFVKLLSRNCKCWTVEFRTHTLYLITDFGSIMMEISRSDVQSFYFSLTGTFLFFSTLRCWLSSLAETSLLRACGIIIWSIRAVRAPYMPDTNTHAHTYVYIIYILYIYIFSSSS